MRFLLDENVHIGVLRFLAGRGHDSIRVPDILAVGSEDPIVATAAMEEGRILVSHDGDMRRIERKISQGHRDRYPALSRLMFCLPEPMAVERLEMFLPLVQFEFEQATRAQSQMLFEICERRVRIHR